MVYKNKKQVSKMEKKDLVSLIKKVSLKQEELKRYSYDVGDTTYYQGIARGENLLWFIKPGTTNYNRVGTKIYIAGIRVSIEMTSDAFRSSSSTNFRIMAYRSSEKTRYGSSNPGMGDVGVCSGIPGYNGNPVLSTIDPQVNNTLYDKWHQVPQCSSSSSVSSKIKQVYIPIHQNYQFDGSDYAAKQGIYLAILANSYGATIISTVTGYTNINYTVYYRDA